ncbi:hypothetical protein J2W28_004381 [Variovorax boronicumulans]|uniref:hypothetical protein n=1 Tax=Variovorax boronicumulans TaxID=436515 RepID=UPI002780DEA5|nr:hypothetical protein [Variovorax boronicumulans]MDP9993918.1 hypothetical protein [Variovorax boronicumulans]MDQ0005219.1 hypothetical protein [Variovorax boronicumulans]
MSTLHKLRGALMLRVPVLGRTLTLYRQGARSALFSFLATVVLCNLPWRLIPAVGEILQMLVAAFGFYFSAALIGSLTPDDVDADTASRR